MGAPAVGRLDRMLQFANLAINAGAIPLPLELGPSSLPHDQASPIAIDPGTPHDAGMVEHATPPVPPPDDHAPPTLDSAPQDADAKPDAVARSLQAAIDAVHHSLSDAGGLPPSSHVDAFATAAHPIASLDQPSADSATHDHAPDAAAVTALHVSPDLAGDSALNMPDLAVLDGGSAQLGGLDATLARVVGDTIHEAFGLVGNTVQDVAQTAGSLDVPVTDALTHTLDAALADAPIDSPQGSTLAPAAAALGMLLAPSGTGAVTAPSLDGLGTDALAGLLHPAASAAPAPIHAGDPAPNATHDMAVFSVIGIPEANHADIVSAHQEVAHPAHLVGSGLI